jgi:hypothetical protein
MLFWRAGQSADEEFLTSGQSYLRVALKISERRCRNVSTRLMFRNAPVPHWRAGNEKESAP